MTSLGQERPATVWVNGAVVGRYVLLAPLAQGGMAEIWLARQSGMRGFEKLVVVKRLMNALEEDPDSVEMFHTEARLAAQLSHPNVVQVYELGEVEGSSYIAMEYLDGENLATIRRAAHDRSVPLPDALSAKLVAMAAEGLHYAHTKVGLDGAPLGIVHRDVSPQNLIVTYVGGLKVVDFGIAKVATSATASGKLKGKFGYMSPEQARGEVVDARSDVFALGIVLFELLTDTRLTRKLSDVELLATIGQTPVFPRVRERRPDAPEGLDAIVAKAMASDRAQRFQSAREVQLALEEWLRTTGQASSSADVVAYMERLFAERMQQRRSLIEVAMTAEPTTDARRKIARLVQKVELESHPSAADIAALPEIEVLPESGSSGTRPRSKVPMVVGAGVVLAAAVAGWLLLRPAPEPVVAAVVEAPAPPTKRAPAILSVTSDPVGASVTIDGVPRGTTPLVLDTLSFGEHLVEGTLTNFQAAKRTVALERSGETTQVVLALTPVAPPEAPRPGPAVRTAHGKLTLKTEPWTTVFLGKQKLGDTPLIGVSVPSGKLVLRLENPEANITSSIEVTIKPGETTVKKLRL